MRIAMIGGGYVGLVSGACFAEFGINVSIVETNPARLSALRDGRIPIYEPGLDALVSSNSQAGRLTFGDDIAQAVTGAEAVFIAVGTPLGMVTALRTFNTCTLLRARLRKP